MRLMDFRSVTLSAIPWLVVSTLGLSATAFIAANYACWGLGCLRFSQSVWFRGLLTAAALVAIQPLIFLWTKHRREAILGAALAYALILGVLYAIHVDVIPELPDY